MSHLKKVLNIAESLHNTHELRQKIDQFSSEPSNDIESYVAYQNIQDDGDANEEIRIVIIFTTKRILSFLSKQNNLHLDATYRLNWNNYPVMICGVTNVTGMFFPSMTVLSSHEDAQAWSEIYGFIHDQGVHPQKRMADGSLAISKAGEEIFGGCPDCRNSSRLMCWSHVHRNIVPKLKTIGSIDKDVEKSIIKDIEDIQWACTDETFHPFVTLLEKKYVENNSYSDNLVSAISVFFKYFNEIWVNSNEFKWYEGANPFRSSNNQGIEGQNKNIKASQTMRKRLPLGSFVDVCLRMCNEWSLNDNTMLEASREQHLFSQKDGLSLRQSGEHIYPEHF